MSNTEASEQHIEPGSHEETRRQLIVTALKLFAEMGVSGTSLRKITAAAGASNQSAVHYHFSNKQGLVSAVLEAVNENLRPLQNDALNELESLSQNEQLSVRDVVAIGFAPYIFLLKSQTGRMSLRFLARLTWESGVEGQELLIQKIRPYFLSLLPYFHSSLPGKALEALDFHMYLGASNLIHGLADISLLGKEPESHTARLYRERPVDLLNYFYDYLSAGLSSDTGNFPTQETPSRFVSRLTVEINKND